MAESRTLSLILQLKDEASKELAGINKQLKAMEPEFKRMAVAGTVAFAGIGVVVGKSIKAASDLEESVNAVNVVFGEGAETILKFGQDAAKSVGLAQSSFNQLSTITGALLRDVGLPMEQVAETTIDLTTRAADLASVFNTTVQDALSAMNQAIRGETEAIRRYAGDVTDATLEQYRLAEGIDTSVKEMNEQQKRLLRIQLLMEQTNVAAGDFANTSGSLANQQRILREQFKDISATIGTAFVPMVTDLLATVRPVIANFADWVKENPKLAKNLLMAAGGVSALVAITGTLGLLLPGVLTSFRLLSKVLLLDLGKALPLFSGGTATAIARLKALRAVAITTSGALTAVAGAALLAALQIRKANKELLNAKEGLAAAQKKQADTTYELLKKSQADIQAAEESGNAKLIEMAEAKAAKARAIASNADKSILDSVNARVQSAQAALASDSASQQQWADITGASAKKADDAFESIDFNSILSNAPKAQADTEELTKLLDDASSAYQDFKESAGDALFSLVQEHQNTLDDFESRIDGIRDSMRELEASFARTQQQDRLGIAEEIAGAQDEILALEQEIAEAGAGKRKEALEQELAEKQAVLSENADLIASLENEITEARRRAGLTDLERAIEDFNAKRELELQQFNARMSELKQELEQVKEQREQEKELFKDKVSFIVEQTDELLERHKEFTDNSLAITKDAIEQEIEYYRQLAAAIGAARGSNTVAEFNRAVGSVTRVNDAVISPSGDIISTHPNDYLIATQNPGELGGNGLTVIVNGDVTGRELVEKVSRELAMNIKRTIRV